MRLTLPLAKKTRRVVVRLVSMAGTGTSLECIRERSAPKLVRLQFDKAVQQKVLFAEEKKLRSLRDPYSIDPWVNPWKLKKKKSAGQ